ncbi:MAG: DUF4102 domain-containing protein [Acetobacteraceae bacterium]|nr:DUF4102 domain-containing protein [Acetobacteraceae bacterium]
MNGLDKTVTDRTLKGWLASGPVDRGIGDGLTFVASEASAGRAKASCVLRYRHAGRQREKVLGRYPELTLKDAREQARKDRALLQQGSDPAALKREEALLAQQARDVEHLGEIWLQRHIEPRYKHPQVVRRILDRHVHPRIGKLAVPAVREHHIDDVLTAIVRAGAPTVANDVLHYLFRMFHFAVQAANAESRADAARRERTLDAAGGTKTLAGSGSLPPSPSDGEDTRCSFVTLARASTPTAPLSILSISW